MPTTVEMVSKLWSVHTVKHQAATQEDKLLRLRAAPWVTFTCSVLNESSQTQMETHCPKKPQRRQNKPAVTEGRLSLSAWTRSCLDRAQGARLSLFLLSCYPGMFTFDNLLSPVFTI